jgi:hypothetical protein
MPDLLGRRNPADAVSDFNRVLGAGVAVGDINQDRVNVKQSLRISVAMALANRQPRRDTPEFFMPKFLHEPSSPLPPEGLRRLQAQRGTSRLPQNHLGGLC